MSERYSSENRARIALGWAPKSDSVYATHTYAAGTNAGKEAVEVIIPVLEAWEALEGVHQREELVNGVRRVARTLATARSAWQEYVARVGISGNFERQAEHDVGRYFSQIDRLLVQAKRELGIENGGPERESRRRPYGF